jgi:hypothetical protein
MPNDLVGASQLGAFLPSGATVEPGNVDAAVGEVRRHCGWHLGVARTEELTLDTLGERVLYLPSRMVTAVASVELDGVDITTDAIWYPDGRLLRSEFGVWPCSRQGLVVNLTHGYATPLNDIPEVIGVVAALAVRLRAALMPDADIVSTTIGAHTWRVSEAGPFRDAERDTLEPYALAYADAGIV